MSKKISELEEITNLNSPTYTIVDQGGGGVNAKFNLQNLNNEINKTNNILGEIEEFNTGKKYYPGQFVKYQNKIYKFINIHQGEWDNTKVSEVNLYSELKSIELGDFETIHITLSSEDGLLDVSDRAVTIEFSDSTPTINPKTNSDGYVEVSDILKGKSYTVSVVPRDGYITPLPMNYIASISDRYVNLLYRKTLNGTATITVRVDCNNGSTLMNGKQVSLYSNSTTIYQSQIITDGLVTFTDIPIGQSYTIKFEPINAYITPSDQIIAVLDSQIGLSATYKYITSEAGIYIRDSQGNEVLCEEAIEISGSTYVLKPEYQDRTWIAFHIASDELLKVGCDYYVRPLDLTNSGFSISKQYSSVDSMNNRDPSTIWSSTLKNYNGKKNTYLLFKTHSEINKRSQAAEYVNTIQWNNNTGYIGTRDQIQEIIDNKDIIYNTLTALGLTGVYYSKAFISSSESGDSRTFWLYWGSGTWLATAGYFFRTSSYPLIPFFSPN